MASASGYNHQRFARAVLKKSRKWEPSLTVQLYANHWRFHETVMNFQYDGPMTPFLLALRAQVIPSTLIPFLYDIQPPISFVDGCLVVEIQDFRVAPESKTRVVMRPGAETLPQTIDVMLSRRQERWDQDLTLQLESRIISATSPPLYLGTSILATRNAVLALGLTTPAGNHVSAEGGFRPTQAVDADDTSEIETMRKLLRAGEKPKGSVPMNWSILRLKERLASAAKLNQAQSQAGSRGESVQPLIEDKASKKRPADAEEPPKKKKKKTVKADKDDGEVKPKKKIKKKQEPVE